MRLERDVTSLVSPLIQVPAPPPLPPQSTFAGRAVEPRPRSAGKYSARHVNGGDPVSGFSVKLVKPAIEAETTERAALSVLQ